MFSDAFSSFFLCGSFSQVTKFTPTKNASGNFFQHTFQVNWFDVFDEVVFYSSNLLKYNYFYSNYSSSFYSFPSSILSNYHPSHINTIFLFSNRHSYIRPQIATSAIRESEPKAFSHIALVNFCCRLLFLKLSSHTSRGYIYSITLYFCLTSILYGDPSLSP